MSTCQPPRDYSQKVWCFQCGNEYFPEVTECIECGVATTANKPPDVTVLGKPGEANHLAYDFHEWTAESRSMIEGLLSRANVLHIWQGASLLVGEDDERAVDEFISEVDAASRPILDPDVEKIIYEMHELTDSQVTTLTQALEDEGTAYQITAEGDLIIEAKDESRVEAVFDRLEAAAAERESRLIGDGGDLAQTGNQAGGVEVPSLLSDLYRLSSKLEMLIPLNYSDLIDARRALDSIFQLDLPFGFSSEQWEEIVHCADKMDELLAGHLGEAGEEISPDLQEAAERLKEVLPIAG